MEENAARRRAARNFEISNWALLAGESLRAVNLALLLVR